MISPQWNRKQLGEKLVEAAYITGEFVLHSGEKTTKYFDKYRFEAQPDLLSSVAQHMAKLIPNNIEVLAGIEVGGIPIATALSLHTGVPMVIVRKAAKEHGTCNLVEGMDITGKNLLIIEDVITSGKQVALSYKDLAEHGANIHSVLCVLYRGSPPSPENFQNLGSSGLLMQSLFSKEELLD